MLFQRANAVWGPRANAVWGPRAKKMFFGGGGGGMIHDNDLDHVHFQSAALDRSPIDSRVQCSTQVMLYNSNMLYNYNIMKAES